MNLYTVYVKTDERGCIVDAKSSAFLQDATGYIPIARGAGRQYLHAGLYFPGGLTDERGVFRFKMEDDAVMQRTQAEMDADYTPPEQTPTDRERIEALEKENAALKEKDDLLTACVLEMSELLYA